MKKIPQKPSYADIDWNNIDYNNLNRLKKVICPVIKKYYWDRRQNAQQSELITGLPCEFLINLFKIYHTEWSSRIGSYEDEVIGFRVVTEYKHKNQCFSVELKDFQLKDAIFSVTKLSKKSRTENDIKEACRNAIKDYKDALKCKYIGKKCPITGIEITKNNSDVHHYNKSWRDLINDWVTSQGGWEQVVRYVDYTTPGTLTFFASPEIVQDFIKYHNANTNLVVLHKDGHKMVTNSQYCQTEKQMELVKRYT